MDVDECSSNPCTNSAACTDSTDDEFDHYFVPSYQSSPVGYQSTLASFPTALRQSTPLEGVDSVVVTLPFVFPFYSSPYASLTIWNTGLISLGNDTAPTDFIEPFFNEATTYADVTVDVFDGADGTETAIRFTALDVRMFDVRLSQNGLFLIALASTTASSSAPSNLEMVVGARSTTEQQDGPNLRVCSGVCEYTEAAFQFVPAILVDSYSCRSAFCYSEYFKPVHISALLLTQSFSLHAMFLFVVAASLVLQMECACTILYPNTRGSAQFLAAKPMSCPATVMWTWTSVRAARVRTVQLV